MSQVQNAFEENYVGVIWDHQRKVYQAIGEELRP